MIHVLTFKSKHNCFSSIYLKTYALKKSEIPGVVSKKITHFSKPHWGGGGVRGGGVVVTIPSLQGEQFYRCFT